MKVSRLAAAQRTEKSDDIRAPIVLVGRWSALPEASDVLRVRRTVVLRAPADVRQLKETIAARQPAWLLIGHSVEEWHIRSLVLSAQAMRPALQVAMLGAPDDTRRCNRWMHRGCSVYLDVASDADHVLAALDLAQALRVFVIDRAFHETARARRVQPVDSLTRREEEVLQLICVGLRNADIAQSLNLTENTVESHVSRLLAKLGARNRVEAVGRATALGLS